jgi:hypothetical protein
MAALSLLWEFGHARFYTLWMEATPAYVAFAIAHCTAGDMLIGAGSLLLALVITREAALERWRRARIALLTAMLGTTYTVFSEWMNITILRSWSYTDSMPTADVGGFRLGLLPVAQWLLLPPLAVYLAQIDLRQWTGRRES